MPYPIFRVPNRDWGGAARCEFFCLRGGGGPRHTPHNNFEPSGLGLGGPSEREALDILSECHPLAAALVDFIAVSMMMSPKQYTCPILLTPNRVVYTLVNMFKILSG